MKQKLDRFFHISERNSTISKEIFGGITTFLAMFYILPVNSNLLKGLSLGNDKFATYGGIFLALAIASAVSTLFMGIFANFPVALSSGMGINLFVAYTVCGELKFSYTEALFLTLLAGLIFILMSVTNIRGKILNSIPKNLKIAIGSGIGFFITYIGFKNAGIVEIKNGSFLLGDFTQLPVLFALLGVFLVLFLGHLKNKKISQFSVVISLFTIGILCATVGTIGHSNGQNFDLPKFYNADFEYGQLSTFKDLFGSLFINGYKVLGKPEAYAVLFSLILVQFFDTAGTLVAVGHSAQIIDKDGNIINAKRALIADSIGTCIGSICGTTTVTTFAESMTGISAGAKTGFSSIIVSILFFLSILIFPALSMFGATPSGKSPVTSLALIYVGTLIFSQLKELEWKNYSATTSAFITVLMMVLTSSICDGIAFGFITYVLCELASKKYKEITPLMYVISIVFIIYYIIKFTILK